MLFSFLIIQSALAGWNVDCGNYCFFNEMTNNCQGVFYQTNPNDVHTKVYSTWNKSMNGCLANSNSLGVYKLIKPNQISCSCPKQNAPAPNKNHPLSQSTKEKLKILKSQIESWTLCGPWPLQVNPADPNEPYNENDLRLCQKERLNGGRDTFPLNANNCMPGISAFKNGTCDYSGDYNNHMATFCLYGNYQACHIIKQAQASDGSWYRNPFMKRYPLAVIAHQPAFSRDQSLGSLAYWLMTKDRNSMINWLEFIDNNGKTAPWVGGFNLYNLCPPRVPGPRPNNLTQAEWDSHLPDDRCAVLNVLWGLIYSVAKHIGIKDKAIRKINPEFLQLMKTGILVLDQNLLMEANTVPVVGALSFQIKLAYLSLIIRQRSGGNNQTVKNALKRISERTNNLSVFYYHAAEDFQPKEYTAHLIQKYCKPFRQKYGQWPTQGWESIGNNHPQLYKGEHFTNNNYQYAGGRSYYGPITTPSGHGCILMIDMLLNSNKKLEAECDGNDPLINGACQKFAFAKPKLARVPGLGYHFNAWVPELTYVAVHHKECPYGGTLKSGPYSELCAIPINLNPNTLDKSLSYKIDLHEDKYDIYYPALKLKKGWFGRTNFSCPSGGIRRGNRCVIVNYPSPYLRQNVHYTVATNPAWPGVFYPQVNNQCPYGGVKGGPNCMLKGFPPGFLKQNTQYFVRRNPAYPGVYYYPKTTREEPVPREVRDIQRRMSDENME